MAAYSIEYTATSVTVTVTGASSGETYRFLLRYNTDASTAQIAQEDVTATGTTVAWSYGGLTPETGYAVNVGPVVTTIVGYEEAASVLRESGTVDESFSQSGYSLYDFDESSGIYSAAGTTETVSMATPGTTYYKFGTTLWAIYVGPTGAYSLYSKGRTPKTQTGANWIGAQTFETDKEGGGVYINGKLYTPYIFTNGVWKKATPHVYSGGWKATEGTSNE